MNCVACGGPIASFYFFDSSKNQCKHPDDPYSKYFSCGERPGAKYQNNQCTQSTKSRQEFICLNRMDIDEKEIRKTPVFNTFTEKRINHFEYFTKHNKTHIICGDKSLEKTCHRGSNQFQQTGVLCQNEKKTKERFITTRGLCTDFEFMKAKGYPSKEFWLQGYTVHQQLGRGTSSYCNKGFHCQESKKCLFVINPYSTGLNPDIPFACDGKKQCSSGDDENFEMCKANNAFSKYASIECLEPNRPSNSPLKIMAILCDGNSECAGNLDENWCDIALKWFLWLFSIGLGTISLATAILSCFHKKNKVPNELELGEIKRSEELDFEEWHQKDDRGNSIAFRQSLEDRKLQNLALMSSEIAHHGSRAEAVLCLKVKYAFRIFIDY